MYDPQKNKKADAGQDQQTNREQPSQDINKENENVAAAYQEASKDIEDDPDLSIQSPNDDLDEEESARLGNKTGLV